MPASVLEGLRAVDHLAPGEYGVREGKPRGPVDEAVVFATLPHLHPVAAALVELLWWTGARPSELMGLRPCDIDRSGEVWVAKLERHKTAHRGKVRELDFGPQAQKVLRRFLDRVPRPPKDKPLFSPSLAMADYTRLLRERRKSPLWPSHVERYEREAGRRKRIEYGDRYTASALRIAIERAISRANRERRKSGEELLPHWTPYMIRHSALTRIRKARGLEAAQAIGGHAVAAVTEGYSQQAERELARRIAGELG